jgi:hypothetical protein
MSLTRLVKIGFTASALIATFALFACNSTDDGGASGSCKITGKVGGYDCDADGTVAVLYDTQAKCSTLENGYAASRSSLTNYTCKATWE